MADLDKAIKEQLDELLKDMGKNLRPERQELVSNLKVEFQQVDTSEQAVDSMASNPHMSASSVMILVGSFVTNHIRAALDNGGLTREQFVDVMNAGEGFRFALMYYLNDPEAFKYLAEAHIKELTSEERDDLVKVSKVSFEAVDESIMALRKKNNDI